MGLELAASENAKPLNMMTQKANICRDVRLISNYFSFWERQHPAGMRCRQDAGAPRTLERIY